jgi:GNAT superfamily N-acetyltransferase
VTLRIERATPRDVPLIFNFIRKLAEYEKMLDRVVSTEQDLSDALFGPRPVAETLLAYVDDQPVGFVLYFETYSTFRGRRGIFLEDVFVEPQHRGKGVGKRLLGAVAQVARERGGAEYGWMQWLVLDWNESAIEFYSRLGAIRVEEWDSYRLQGDALARLAVDS